LLNVVESIHTKFPLFVSLSRFLPFALAVALWCSAHSAEYRMQATPASARAAELRWAAQLQLHLHPEHPALPWPHHRHHIRHRLDRQTAHVVRLEPRHCLRLWLQWLRLPHMRSP